MSKIKNGALIDLKEAVVKILYNNKDPKYTLNGNNRHKLEIKNFL